MKNCVSLSNRAFWSHALKFHTLNLSRQIPPTGKYLYKCITVVFCLLHIASRSIYYKDLFPFANVTTETTISLYMYIIIMVAVFCFPLYSQGWWCHMKKIKSSTPVIFHTTAGLGIRQHKCMWYVISLVPRLPRNMYSCSRRAWERG